MDWECSTWSQEVPKTQEEIMNSLKEAMELMGKLKPLEPPIEYRVVEALEGETAIKLKNEILIFQAIAQKITETQILGIEHSFFLNDFTEFEEEQEKKWLFNSLPEWEPPHFNFPRMKFPSNCVGGIEV